MRLWPRKKEEERRYIVIDEFGYPEDVPFNPDVLRFIEGRVAKAVQHTVELTREQATKAVVETLEQLAKKEEKAYGGNLDVMAGLAALGTGASPVPCPVCRDMEPDCFVRGRRMAICPRCNKLRCEADIHDRRKDPDEERERQAAIGRVVASTLNRMGGSCDSPKQNRPVPESQKRDPYDWPKPNYPSPEKGKEPRLGSLTMCDAVAILADCRVGIQCLLSHAFIKRKGKPWYIPLPPGGRLIMDRPLEVEGGSLSPEDVLAADWEIHFA